MTAYSSRRKPQPSYYAICCDYGSRGREVLGDPEQTRADVVAMIKSGEYQKISFIQFISDGIAEDVTDELLNEAEADLKTEARDRADQIAAQRDHNRDLRKHEVA
jgi:hypothetical protein